MGTIYVRGGILYIGFRGVDGKWHYRTTGYRVGEESKARVMLAELEVAVAKGVRLDTVGPVSVKSYAATWTKRRVDHGLSNAKKEGRQVELHALPLLGRFLLTEVRPRHLRELVSSLRSTLAPRTLANVYGAVHRLFADAVADELVEVSPCQLPSMEMPRRRDKDPHWRATAIYTREEAETLLSHPDVPADRRITYALALLGGLREGEVSALTWSSYDTEAEPLGRLSVTGSYARAHKRVKSTKSGANRAVPVHPTLARLLAAWKLTGWAGFHGRPPTAKDLIVPSRAGTHLTDLSVMGGLKFDLAKLGLSHRRYHDMRRTFITLALSDGASRDVLRWVTHGPSRDVIDLYTSLPWVTLCESVGQLKLRARGGGRLVSVSDR